jgi:hypothetical protein
MKHANLKSNVLLATAIAGLLGSAATANVTEPCGDLGECKALIEINSTDGDAGFHFLMDGDDFIYASMYNPHWKKIFSYVTRRELRDQTLTETFAESAEPLCWYDPDADEEDLEDVVTLEDFLGRFYTGKYHFVGVSEGWELAFGRTNLTFALPAAPDDLEYEEEEETDEDGEVDIVGEISWEAGDDLGNCAEIPDEEDGDDPNIPNLADILHLLDEAPEDVPVASWEVVFEPDFDEGHPMAALSLKYTSRIPGDAELEVEVPSDYLESLPDNTPVKVEIGAIGYDDNATFTEIDEICVNEDDENEDDDVDGCGFEIEDDEEDD